MYKIESYLKINRDAVTLQNIVDHISKNIKENSSIKNAGHESIKDLTETLNWSLIDYKKGSQNMDIKYTWDEEKIKQEVNTAINKCHKQLYYKDTTIMIFPTFSDFVFKQMDGVSGFTPNKNIMNIFVHHNYNPKAILGTISHEYAHTISYNFKFTQNLLSSIVLEGLAEIFYEKMTGTRSKYCQALNYDDSIKLAKILPLEKKGWDEVRELFTKNNKYPMWAGYAMSYFLVKKYLDNSKKTIEEILLINPKEISKEIKNLIEH